MMSIYMVTKTTSYMFFTAMAGNILALKMINDILHLQISWGGWALAAGLPGIIMLLVTPLVIYTMYPPEIKKVDNKTIAKAGPCRTGTDENPRKNAARCLCAGAAGLDFQ